MKSIRIPLKTPEFRDDIYKHITNLGIKVSSMEYRKDSGVLIINSIEDVPIDHVESVKLFSNSLNKTYVIRDMDNYGVDKAFLDDSSIEKYIDSNVTDLISAKAYLKRLSKAVLFLYKRLEES